ncbi:hypothetical protein [Yoonia sp. 208BN28-4]|uniref:hypothetical protein n=1 Tax=Yoonia sp. 208BN28-4 TaxID=3126505 RepID=UPI0030A36782
MRSVLTAGLCALGLSASAQGYPLEDVLNLPQSSTLVFDRSITLDPAMRQTVTDNLRDATYFGAFALHPSTAYGYANEANSVAAAEASALRFCSDVSDYDGQCRIVARLLPKGVSPDNYPPISPAISEGVIEVYGLNEQGFAAIASSGDGAWGSSLNGRDVEEAVQIAMDSCEEWRVSGDETPLAGFPCEVVTVMHSDDELPLR